MDSDFSFFSNQKEKKIGQIFDQSSLSNIYPKKKDKYKISIDQIMDSSILTNVSGRKKSITPKAQPKSFNMVQSKSFSTHHRLINTVNLLAPSLMSASGVSRVSAYSVQNSADSSIDLDEQLEEEYVDHFKQRFNITSIKLKPT